MISSLVLVWHCSLGRWIASLDESMTGGLFLILGLFTALEVPLWTFGAYMHTNDSFSWKTSLDSYQKKSLKAKHGARHPAHGGKLST